MKLTDLEAFVAIVDAGALTAAAKQIGVTQPALSRLLRNLETHLNVDLFRRTGRGIELTPAGTEFLAFAAQTLDHFAQTRRRIADKVDVAPGKISLSVPLRLGRLLIPHLYRDFADAMPDTVLHVVEEPSSRAQAMLAEHQLDAALTYRAKPGSDAAFVPLYKEHLYAVGNKRIMAPGRAPIPLAEVGTLPILLPSTGPFRSLIQSTCSAAGVELQIARALETAEGLLAFAAEADGIAILPMSNVYQEVARKDVVARRIVRPSITRVIGLQFAATVSRHSAGQLIRVLRKSMRKSARDADWRVIGAPEEAGG